MYLNGQGVPRNSNKAVYWLERAADDNLVVAQSILGIMYATGQGVAPNVEKAQLWLTKAAEGGDTAAAGVLRRLRQNTRT